MNVIDEYIIKYITNELKNTRITHGEGYISIIDEYFVLTIQNIFDLTYSQVNDFITKIINENPLWICINNQTTWDDFVEIIFDIDEILTLVTIRLIFLELRKKSLNNTLIIASNFLDLDMLIANEIRSKEAK